MWNTITVKKKLNKDDIRPGIYLVQSLERVPSLLNRKDITPKVVLFNHLNSDQAVKNQLIQGPEGFHVDETLSDLDSVQLRKYFDDQQIIVDFVESQFPTESLYKTNDFEALVEIIN